MIYALMSRRPEVKLPEGSEGRPSFGRKPKDGNKFIKPKDALF